MLKAISTLGDFKVGVSPNALLALSYLHVSNTGDPFSVQLPTYDVSPRIVARSGSNVGQVDDPIGMCESTTTPDKIVVCDSHNRRIQEMPLDGSGAPHCRVVVQFTDGTVVAMAPQTTSSLIMGIHITACIGSAGLMAIPSGL